MKITRNMPLYGYVYPDGLRHNGPVRLKAEQIPAFLMAAATARRVVIKNLFDIQTLTAAGSIIDFCADTEYLEQELKPALVPTQTGQAPVETFVELPEAEFTALIYPWIQSPNG